MRLVYLAPVPWSTYEQRPHYVVRCLMEQGVEAVLWLDPYPGRLPRWSDVRRLRPDLHGQPTAPRPGVTVESVPAVPAEPLPGGVWLNRVLCWGRLRRRVSEFLDGGGCIGIGRPSALGLELVADNPAAVVWYDAMDDFSAFSGGLASRHMVRLEQAILARARLVTTSAQVLRQQFERQGVHSLLLANATWTEHCPSPDRVGAGADRTPRLGYVGALADWLDWDWVGTLARTCPGAQLDLYGPVFSPPPRDLPDNVHVLPPLRHDRAMAALDRCHVGLIPFKVNRLTAAVDPVKYYDYRCLGLPVLSSSFGTMALRATEPGVFLWSGASDTAAERLAAALAHRDTAAGIACIRADNDWRTRVKDCGLGERLMRIAERPAQAHE